MRTTLTTYDNGELVEVEEVEVEDTRSTLECKDTDGSLLTPTKLYEATSGHVTHRCVGEQEPRLRVSCPKAEYWNSTCGEHILTEVSEDMTPAQLQAAQVEAFQAIFGMVEQMRTNGCPVHDPVTAAPATLDGLLQTLTPERMAELFAAVSK